MPEYRERHGSSGPSGSGVPTLSLTLLEDSGVPLGEETNAFRVVRGTKEQREQNVGAPPRGTWTRFHVRDVTHPASTNLALEAAFRPFLSELTISQRDVLRLLFWEGMSEQDAADQLGISRASLRERRDRAIVRLSKALVATSKVDDDIAPSELYRRVREWLTPNQRINAWGETDRWEGARCTACNLPLAKYLPNALGLPPALMCNEH